MVFVPPGESEDGLTPEKWIYPTDTVKQSIEKIHTEAPYVSPGIYTQETIQNNKAFSFGASSMLPEDSGPGGPGGAPPTLPNPLAGLDDPMSIPLASATLPIDMTVAADDLIHNWITSDGYDDAGGFLELVQRLVCGPEYQMLFRYCFNIPRTLSALAIYIIQAFIPSIGRANPAGAESPGLFSVTDTFEIEAPPDDIPSSGIDHDGWYAPAKVAGGMTEYYGGGIGTGIFVLNFKRWDHLDAFGRSKRTLSQGFTDLYNSNDPSYNSDSFNDSSARDAREALKVTWPKFMFRLRQKKVDRPYDKNGDICD